MKSFLKLFGFGINKSYSEIDFRWLESFMNRLKYDVAEKFNAGKVTIYIDPLNCISSSILFVNNQSFNDPKRNALIVVEFLTPNKEALPLITFRMGKEKCEISQSRDITQEEALIFKKMKVLPLSFESSNAEEALYNFSNKVNLISSYESKKSKEEIILLKEKELESLLKKEQSESVIKGVKISQNQLSKLKENFNKEYGYTYPL